MYGGSGGPGPQTQIREFFLRGGTPVTLALIVANVITFFIGVAAPSLGLVTMLAFVAPLWLQHPWTLLTWPLVAAETTTNIQGPINLLFSLGWMYSMGGSLERSWGTRLFGTAAVAVAAITALAVWVGSFVPGAGPGILAGLWVLAAAVTVAWAVTHRGEVISFFGLPLPAPALILLGVGIAWYDGGSGLIGLFATSGCAAAYIYATWLRPGASFGGAWSSRTRPAAPNLRFRVFDRETVDGSKRRTWSVAHWWRERQERRRLEAMFRRSGYTDPEERRRRR